MSASARSNYSLKNWDIRRNLWNGDILGVTVFITPDKNRRFVRVPVLNSWSIPKPEFRQFRAPDKDGSGFTVGKPAPIAHFSNHINGAHPIWAACSPRGLGVMDSVRVEIAVPDGSASPDVECIECDAWFASIVLEIRAYTGMCLWLYRREVNFE